MTTVNVWTDGSSFLDKRLQQRFGAWAALIRYGRTSEKLIGAGMAGIEAQEAELLACVNALESLKCPYAVTVHTDSRYVVTRAHGLYTPLSYHDHWERLLAAVQRHQYVNWVHVPGHAGIFENERVNEYVRQVARDYRDRRRKS